MVRFFFGRVYNSIEPTSHLSLAKRTLCNMDSNKRAYPIHSLMMISTFLTGNVTSSTLPCTNVITVKRKNESVSTICAFKQWRHSDQRVYSYIFMCCLIMLSLSNSILGRSVISDQASMYTCSLVSVSAVATFL